MTVSAPMRRAATISTLSNQTFSSSCSLSASARLRDAGRSGVVGGEREQRLVEPRHRLGFVVVVDHEAQVLRAGFDVAFELLDVLHAHAWVAPSPA